MPISFNCSSCGRNLKTPDEMAGKKGKCPHCQAVMDIPLSSTTGTGTSLFDDLPSASAPPKPAPSKPAADNDLFGGMGTPPPPSTYASKPANPYAGPAYQSQPQRHSGGVGRGSNGRAVASLVCGIVSLVSTVFSFGCCCVPFLGGIFVLGGQGLGLTLGLIGWIAGHVEVKAAGPHGSTRGTAMAGMVCGIIGTVLSALVLITIVVLITIGVAANFALE